MPYCGCILIPLLLVGRRSAVGWKQKLLRYDFWRGLIVCGLYIFSLLCYYATLTAAATKTKPIGNDDDCQFTIIVNSASTAAPIGLPPKMAEFCHTPNRLLLGRQCRHALLRLHFNSSATGWSEIKAAGLRRFPPKGLMGFTFFPSCVITLC